MSRLCKSLAPAFRAVLSSQKAQKAVFLLRSACAFDVTCADSPQPDKVIRIWKVEWLRFKGNAGVHDGQWELQALGQRVWKSPALERSTD